MKPSAELFSLIKSLSPSEKRYFKLDTSLQKGNKNYLKLFAAIDRQNEYDEGELKKRYRKENFVKNLTFTKNYLYKLIFKSLNSYYNEKSIDGKINNVLNKCRFMFDRALFPEYFKTLEYGKELSVKYERFYLLLEFLELERQLTKKEELVKKNIADVYDIELRVLDKIRNSNNYKRAVSELFRIYRNNGIARDENTGSMIEKIISLKEFQNEKSALSVTAREKYFLVLYIANEIKGNFTAAYSFNKKRFDFISSHREIFQQFLFDNYKDAFLSLALSAAQAGKFVQAEKLLIKYKREFLKDEKTDIDAQITIDIIKLIKVIKQKVIDDEIPSRIQKYLSRYKGKIIIDIYNRMFFLLSKYFFVTGRYQEALSIINKFFENKTLKYTIHLEPYARMLNCLIHFELHNYKLLHYQIPSVIKYLKSKGKLYEAEFTVLDFLRKAIRKKDDDNFAGDLEFAAQKLIKLKSITYEKNAFEYLDYLAWITALKSAQQMRMPSARRNSFFLKQTRVS